MNIWKTVRSALQRAVRPELDGKGNVRVAEWRVHVGAHKTATTHLQDVIATNQEPLLEAGVIYLPRDFIREHGLVERVKRGLDVSLAQTPSVRAQLLAAPDGQTVAMSEENWLGGVRDALLQPLYPAARANIAALTEALDGAPLTLFLALRSLDGVLPGAYATALRFHHLDGGFELIRRRTLENPPSWVGLVEDIMLAAPHATLRIWQYEDYRANSLRIASVICGASIEEGTTLSDPLLTRTPGAAALAAAERLPADLPPLERRRQVEKIYLASLRTREPKYVPFLPEESAHLKTAYENDLIEIRQRWPTSVMEFSSANDP